MPSREEYVQRATATIREVLSADPRVGPIEVICVESQHDVMAVRFLMLVLSEKKAYFFDRIRNRIFPIKLSAAPLDEVMLLEKAREFAAHERLGNIFVVTPERNTFGQRSIGD